MAVITPFTPVASTVGGMLIGLAGVMLMLFNGRIAGISGILARMFPPYSGSDAVSAAAFVVGLMAAPLSYSVVIGVPVTETVSSNAGRLASRIRYCL